MITAAVLLVILVAVLAAPGPIPFAVLLAVFAVLAMIEWWRLTLARAAVPGGAPAASWRELLLLGDTGARLVLRIVATLFGCWLFVRLLLDYSVLAAPLGALILDSAGSAVLGFGTPGWVEMMQRITAVAWLWALFGWLAVSVYLFFARVERAPFSVLLSAFGLLAVPAACTALLVAYGRGVPYLLSLLAVVWAADIGAYFVGRRVGGRKLAPAISPGKTLSGAIGGMVCAIAWVLASAALAQPTPTGYSLFGADLVARWSWPGAALFGAVLAWVSIAGDLFESLLKRRAGRKDSSQLLPGHGGVFDRIDAVLPTAPLAMLLVL
ncbi:phosphatidate cytidylyltransferase [Verticiella sediminum]|uniref:phosphatidate cytidylyltransferase n=1 Tax=Verticiella sediminum TaxID=1247510 RepID=UPI003CCC75EB